ncbi:MAG: TetR/AcrR family transcriptional regulator [Microbacterium sp.]|uniref:TetR/AcrR family transcriptional regulator n=1 Tax=Microbacterium sp. TaxID=51671 RepID=UPI001AC59D05|nr:helix-turn-helix domain-containing protein [Microbacterium sp.]MBN9153246.1 TetR/AcrR family transcriptional regulator [Microbacterium sp.]
MTEDHEDRESPRATALLDGAVAYLSREGIEDFSLANLASALGTSSRMLIYHFGSRDELLARVQREMRSKVTTELRSRRFDTLSEAVRATWNYYVPRLPHMELFYHLSSRAFEDPAEFEVFTDTAVSNWEVFFAEVAEREGYHGRDAHSAGTLALGGFRGLIHDLLITGDLKRLTRAVDLFAEMLDDHALKMTQLDSPASREYVP